MIPKSNNVDRVIHKEVVMVLCVSRIQVVMLGIGLSLFIISFLVVANVGNGNSQRGYESSTECSRVLNEKTLVKNLVIPIAIE